MRNKNKFLKILMIVFIMLLQLSCSKVYYDVEEDGKGKITIYYNKLTKIFVMKSEEDGSVLSRDKMQEFYERIDSENMNNEKYTLKLENKIEAPVYSYNLFSFYDFEKWLNIKIKGLENLDVSNVRDMSYMFYKTIQVKPDVSRWDVSNVEDMKFMFGGAKQANPDVSKWDVSNVEDMSGMFLNAIKANPNVSNWNVSKVTNMYSMFSNTKKANPDVSRWNVSNVKDMGFMFFYAVKANPDVSIWDVSKVEDMHGMFAYAKKANPDVSRWDMSNVENIEDMFKEATKFISEAEEKIDRLENKTEAEKKELKSYIDDGNVEHLKKLIYELNKSKK